jgi:hypothetical protein
MRGLNPWPAISGDTLEEHKEKVARWRDVHDGLLTLIAVDDLLCPPGIQSVASVPQTDSSSSTQARFKDVYRAHIDQLGEIQESDRSLPDLSALVKAEMRSYAASVPASFSLRPNTETMPKELSKWRDRTTPSAS